MHERLKHLIQKSKELFSLDFIDKLIKKSKFIKVDMYESIKNLKEGQTIELKDVFIGNEKELKSRLILTKLDKKQTEKRANKFLIKLLSIFHG